MSIDNLVKRLQNIMRQDSGVDGDAQRIAQIVWILFLKNRFWKYFLRVLISDCILSIRSESDLYIRATKLLPTFPGL